MKNWDHSIHQHVQKFEYTKLELFCFIFEVIKKFMGSVFGSPCKLATVFEGDQMAAFSIAATTWCRGWRKLLSLACSTLSPIRTLYCRVVSKEVSSTMFKVFDMTQPGIEPRSPGPLANALTPWPMTVKVKLATIVEGDPNAPFSISTTLRYRQGCYSFPRLLHFTLDPYLIMLSVKQGGIKNHF